MIKVVFERRGFEASGHANFDEYGKDIVCAAVSSILQHASYILRELGGRIDKRKGYLRVTEVPESECAKTVLEVTQKTLLSIQKRYPGNLKVEVR